MVGMSMCLSRTISMLIWQQSGRHCGAGHFPKSNYASLCRYNMGAGEQYARMFPQGGTKDWAILRNVMVRLALSQPTRNDRVWAEPASLKFRRPGLDPGQCLISDPSDGCASHQLMAARLGRARRDDRNGHRSEKPIERWHRTWKFELIERANPDWIDLFDLLV